MPKDLNRIVSLVARKPKGLNRIAKVREQESQRV